MDWLKTIPSKISIKVLKAFSSEDIRLGVKKLLNGVFRIAWQSVVILTLVIFAIAPVVYWLTMPIATPIQAELIVDRVTFRVEKQTAYESIPFHAITVKAFQGIRFKPSAITEPNQKPIAFNRQAVEILAKEYSDLPTVMMETATPATTHFNLSKLSIAAGTEMVLGVKTVKTDKDVHNQLSLEIKNAQSGAPQATIMHNLGFRGAFQVETRHCQVDNLQLPPTFNITGLSRRKPFIEITGQSDRLRLILSISGNNAFEILPAGVSVTGIDFSWEDMVEGNRVINYAKITEGKISYPAYSTIAPVKFEESNIIALGKTDAFQIDKMIFNPEGKGIKLRFSGLAKEAVTTFLRVSPEISIERRLTRSELFAETSKFWAVMFDILKWLIPVIIGVVGIVTINFVRILQFDNQAEKGAN